MRTSSIGSSIHSALARTYSSRWSCNRSAAAHAAAACVLACLSFSVPQRAAAVETIEAASPATEDAPSVRLFSIVLPDGWRMHPLEQTVPNAVRFTFTSPISDQFYIFCEIRVVESTERDQLLRQALEHPDREFLDGGKVDTRYCDHSRMIEWQTKQSTKIVEVEATLFDEHVHRFKFFVPRGEFADFRPQLVQVVHNIRPAGTPPTVDGRTPAWPDPLSEEQLDRLFAKSSFWVWFKWTLLTLTILILGGLLITERMMQMREYKERIADAERQQEERRKALPPDRKQLLADAELYFREVARTPPRKKGLPIDDEHG